MRTNQFRVMTKIMDYLMILLMLVDVGLLTFLPWVAKWYMDWDITFRIENRTGFYYYIMVILYIAGVCTLVVLNELRKMFRTCHSDDPFIPENVKSLHRIGWMCFTIMVLFATKIFVLNSFFTMIFVFVFSLATAFCYVLAHLFDSAVQYKSENDLTI